MLSPPSSTSFTFFPQSPASHVPGTEVPRYLFPTAFSLSPFFSHCSHKSLVHPPPPSLGLGIHSPPLFSFRGPSSSLSSPRVSGSPPPSPLTRELLGSSQRGSQHHQDHPSPRADVDTPKAAALCRGDSARPRPGRHWEHQSGPVQSAGGPHQLCPGRAGPRGLPPAHGTLPAGTVRGGGGRGAPHLPPPHIPLPGGWEGGGEQMGSRCTALGHEDLPDS